MIEEETVSRALFITYDPQRHYAFAVFDTDADSQELDALSGVEAQVVTARE